MLVHIKEIISDAQTHNYAVGAFNIHNLETALGVARAAVKMKSPVIIQVSEGAIVYMGLGVVKSLITILAEQEASSVPIALHLDHGKKYTSITECVTAGFSSVHMDGSDLPLLENIAITKKAVDFAHKKKVWVQGEVGPLLGGHGESGNLVGKIPLATPEEVAQFIAATGVDAIAPAIGTAHGSFKEEHIDFVLLNKIKKVIGRLPLVMHGGSGNDDTSVIRAIKAGVNIINIGTDIKVAFSQTVIQQAKANPQETDPRKLLSPSILAVQKLVEAKMKLFGSAGKA
jgi:ketose-bisphosphate aldolase